MEAIQKASELLKTIKESRPIIHHITNYVTMNDCANIVLAIGGSPIMANDAAEVSEVVAISKALVLNIGTPNHNNFRSMLLAGEKANELGIPIVFDPVGAGATNFRKEICSKLLADIKPAVIKGNLSEIVHLASFDGCNYGIDSYLDVDNGKEIVQELAGRLNCIVAATGRMDIVSDGKITYTINNGHEMLSRITGTGCMISSLVGVFCSVTQDYLIGTAGGIMAMGISGRLAFDSLLPNEGVGMFKTRLFDNIYNLDESTFLREGEINAV
ncbi:MAG TPA: hydroxyethylthiazole kinase [Clostridia bacterium]|nr:hydroxyethylthiazole kinase [Clostridia bacterium]